jgi:CheY-like chemotaxis protein
MLSGRLPFLSGSTTVPEQTEISPTSTSLRVLLVDDDADIAEVVTAILGDEGYAVVTLAAKDHASIAAAVGVQEPDCVLLDGSAGSGFDDSWTEAAYLAARQRAVPTIMFSAHGEAVAEARDGASERATAARFAAVVAKPFSIDDLLEAVAHACGRSEPFDGTPAGERARTEELVRRLRAAGATDMRVGNRREWATFASMHDENIYQLYWWQRLGVYIVGRYDEEAHLEIVGRHFELDAAIAAALPSS